MQMLEEVQKEFVRSLSIDSKVSVLWVSDGCLCQSIGKVFSIRPFLKVHTLEFGLVDFCEFGKGVSESMFRLHLAPAPLVLSYDTI